PEGIAQAVEPQVREGIDRLKAGAIGEMKDSHGIMGSILRAGMSKICERNATKRRRKGMLVISRCLQQFKECIYDIGLLRQSGQFGSEIIKQSAEAVSCEARRRRVTQQRTRKQWDWRQRAVASDPGQF